MVIPSSNRVAQLTVKTKFCVTVPEPFLAVMVIGYVPAVPALGVPLNVSLEPWNVIPLGSVPDFVTVGAGKPVLVTWNENGLPTVASAEVALVMVGASLILMVSVSVAVPKLLVAAITTL